MSLTSELEKIMFTKIPSRHHRPQSLLCPHISHQFALRISKISKQISIPFLKSGFLKSNQTTFKSEEKRIYLGLVTQCKRSVIQLI